MTPSSTARRARAPAEFPAAFPEHAVPEAPAFSEGAALSEDAFPTVSPEAATLSEDAVPETPFPVFPLTAALTASIRRIRIMAISAT